MLSTLTTSLEEESRLALPHGFAPSESVWAKPYSWPELRHITPDSSIGLLLSDKYPYFSLNVTCGGGYKVYIDGLEYGVYESGLNCNIVLAALATQGVLINDPEALTVHTVIISPAVSSAAISAFRCNRYASSGTEAQGVLWAHFGRNQISSLASCFVSSTYTNTVLKAVTAKNNVLYSNNFGQWISGASLVYLPLLKPLTAFTRYGLSGGIYYRASGSCAYVALSSFNGQSSPEEMSFFGNNTVLKKVILDNSHFAQCVSFLECHCNNYSLQELPKYDFTNAKTMKDFLVSCSALPDFTLDLSAASGLKIIGAYGTAARPIRGLKRLIINPKAPFDHTSTPQINIAYSGLNKAALLSLFESLPVVTAGQKINITGAEGSSSLTAADISIAALKGWEVLQ